MTSKFAADSVTDLFRYPRGGSISAGCACSRWASSSFLCCAGSGPSQARRRTGERRGGIAGAASAHVSSPPLPTPAGHTRIPARNRSIPQASSCGRRPRCGLPGRLSGRAKDFGEASPSFPHRSRSRRALAMAPAKVRVVTVPAFRTSPSRGPRQAQGATPHPGAGVRPVPGPGGRDVLAGAVHRGTGQPEGGTGGGG